MISIPYKNPFSSLGVFIFSLFFLSSCVTTQQDVLYLNNQIAALNSKVNGISGDLESVRENQAEVGAEIDKIRGEIQGISGRLVENRKLVERAIERDTTEQDVMRADLSDLTVRIAELEARMTQIYQYLGLEPKIELEKEGPSEHTEILEGTEQPIPGEKDVLPEKALYDSTLSMYREGKYEEAIDGFRRYVKKYPSSDLADNAQFWVGECYMGLKQYEQAILAYQDVIKKYPKGNKVPNAMLRQALAFYEIKDKTSSRLLLKKIVKKYPKSNEAKIAKAKLATIK